MHCRLELAVQQIVPPQHCALIAAYPLHGPDYRLLKQKNLYPSQSLPSLFYNWTSASVAPMLTSVLLRVLAVRFAAGRHGASLLQRAAPGFRPELADGQSDDGDQAARPMVSVGAASPSPTALRLPLPGDQRFIAPT